jgi:hypothetical protein
MDKHIIEILMQACGIGGAALGFFFILINKIVDKGIFPKLARKQAHSLLLVIIVLAFTISVLCISMWFYLRVERNIDHSIRETKKINFVQIKIDTLNSHWRQVDRSEPNPYESAPENKSEKLCPGRFNSKEWCQKSKYFFLQKDLEYFKIDPSFDITLMNELAEPTIILSLGIKLLEAFNIVYTLGDWNSTEVAIEATYKINIPFPKKVIVYHDFEDYRADVGQTVIDTDSLCRHYGVDGFDMREISPYWRLPNLPTTLEAKMKTPIHMGIGAPYRFSLVLENYFQMPNNVVVQIYARTNLGDFESDIIYLLAL